LRHKRLEGEGQAIGANDCLVAATVIAEKRILVTGNVQEFNKVPGLKLENGSRNEYCTLAIYQRTGYKDSLPSQCLTRSSSATPARIKKSPMRSVNTWNQRACLVGSRRETLNRGRLDRRHSARHCQFSFVRARVFRPRE
jgi:hypothetical protein